MSAENMDEENDSRISSNSFSVKVAKLLGDATLHSEKVEKILGGLEPITREQRLAMVAHYEKLREEKEYETARTIKELLNRDLALEQYKLPALKRPLSQKAIKLVGDDMIELQSKYIVRKKSITAKSLRLTGHAVEQLVGRKASQILGDDTVDKQISQLARQRSMRLPRSKSLRSFLA